MLSESGQGLLGIRPFCCETGVCRVRGLLFAPESAERYWWRIEFFETFPLGRRFSEKLLLKRTKTGTADWGQNAAVMINKRLSEQDRLVKPGEAADLLALSRRTLRRYEVSGRLHPVKINQRVTRYRLADVLRLMEAPV